MLQNLAIGDVIYTDNNLTTGLNTSAAGTILYQWGTGSTANNIL